MMARETQVREVSVEEAKREFDSLLFAVEHEQAEVLVKEEGRTVARITAPAANDEELEDARKRFVARIDALQHRVAGIPTRELNRAIDSAVKDVRAKQRAGKLSNHRGRGNCKANDNS